MFPFIATVTQAAGIIVDKIILTRRRMELHVYIPVLFLFLFLLTGILMPFLGKISLDVFHPYYLIIFFLMIICALIWNVFYYKGAQAEKVHEFELIIMFQPLLTILLAAILIEKNTNVHLLIASVLASLALIFSHLKKNHFEISAAGWGLILAVVFISMEIILQKIMLEVLSPVALYFIRTGIIFLFFILFYRPRVRQVANNNALLILTTSALGVAQMVTKFYGFEVYGVIYTSLILILSPILVYIISTIWLHEHLRPRTIIAALVILACIVYATIFNFR
jgi:drug/metabolite transporter (DMT)-like permease